MDIDLSQDPRDSLPRDAYFHLIHSLHMALPQSDGTPETIALRDRAAIAQAAALCPASAAEAAIAAQFVAANMQAMECLGLANAPSASPDQTRGCTAQAVTMMRQAQGAVRLLLRLQAERTRREAHEPGATQASWSEHRAASWMLQGLSESPLTGHRPTEQSSEASMRQTAPTDLPAADVQSHHAQQNPIRAPFGTNARLPAHTEPTRTEPTPGADQTTPESHDMGPRITNPCLETLPRPATDTEPPPPSDPAPTAYHQMGQCVTKQPFETDPGLPTTPPVQRHPPGPPSHPRLTATANPPTHQGPARRHDSRAAPFPDRTHAAAAPD